MNSHWSGRSHHGEQGSNTQSIITMQCDRILRDTTNQIGQLISAVKGKRVKTEELLTL